MSENTWMALTILWVVLVVSSIFAFARKNNRYGSLWGTYIILWFVLAALRMFTERD